MDDKLEVSQIIDFSPLDEQIKNTTDKIIKEENGDKLKELVNIFNINQAKKDILRVDTYNKLLDSITQQMELRINKKADEFTNKDLLDYLKAISESADKSKKAFSTVSDMPAIQINQVNIGDNANKELSRESREKVLAAINSYMNKAMQSQEQEEEIIVGTSETENNERNEDD